MADQAPPDTDTPENSTAGQDSPTTDRGEQKAGEDALKKLLRPVAGRLLTGRLLSALSAVLAVVPYIALVQIGAELLTGGAVIDDEAVNHWLLILIGSYTARLVIYFLALAVTHFADVALNHHIRRRMVRRFATVPLSWFTSTNFGRVRKGLQDDIGTVHQLIAHQPVEGTSAVVMPLALMLYAFIVDWRLGLLSIAVIPVYALSMLSTTRGMGEKTVEMDRRLGDVSARMVEFVTGISVVKAFGRVGRAHRSYQRSADEFYDFYLDWVKPLMLVSSVGQSVLAIPLILVVNLGGGALLVNAGYVSAADVLATSLIALLIPYSLETLMTGTWSRQLAGAAALRLTGLLETGVLGDSDAPQTPNGHDVTFDHVTYSYPGASNHAVEDVSFTLPAGTVTALVGPSGSGKSTIATLLARFDDPQEGTVSIGGVPVKNIADLYSHVGFVLQDPQLPSVSIRDNIALGRPDATDAEIRDAAASARVLEEIEALPEGFDTVYGRDAGLSGGQAQRVAIARALLVDAPVLILDEATALTDPESQHEIQQALSVLAEGRTVLVIAHRPEAITGVDRIIRVVDGRIVGAGADHTDSEVTA
ncbi:ABC transporter ATP-binding protein [Corynebacterium terpenotabidum]|uniref:ABC transporter ATP-binding protein/permease n=1 Tax=Corynebacterium terpenotabidum Y-11 TaxID=1200352 RepID=S4XLL6_9CORY|nr:ABC transporter ATP-binding protein [Corynebacterium terpenotabidum]AGP31448.1 ABC transporter ATP-binding protein/permease [Corynebacterium terpenotabidum Y-11]